MDMLTLMVLAEQKKHVQYRMPDFIEAPVQHHRAHASCFYQRIQNMAPHTRDKFMDGAVQIACTTGDCRWCGLPLVSRPHHFLRPPKTARLSKVVGAHNMDPYKRAAPLVFDFETFKPGVIGMDFAAIEARIHGQWEALLAHGYKFNPDIYRK